MKQLHSEIPKLKLFSSKKISVKNNLNSIKLFLRKNLKQKPSKFQYYIVRKLKNSIYYLNACYLIHILPIIYPQCIGSGIQNNGKPNKLLSIMTLYVDMASVVMSWHTCHNLVEVLSTEILWRG